VTAIVNKYRELDFGRLTTMHDPRVDAIKSIVDVVGYIPHGRMTTETTKCIRGGSI
jgi:hypothetical protein